MLSKGCWNATVFCCCSISISQPLTFAFLFVFGHDDDDHVDGGTWPCHASYGHHHQCAYAIKQASVSQPEAYLKPTWFVTHLASSDWANGSLSLGPQWLNCKLSVEDHHVLLEVGLKRWNLCAFFSLLVTAFGELNHLSSVCLFVYVLGWQWCNSISSLIQV